VEPPFEGAAALTNLLFDGGTGHEDDSNRRRNANPYGASLHGKCKAQTCAGSIELRSKGVRHKQNVYDAILHRDKMDGLQGRRIISGFQRNAHLQLSRSNEM
jgi:hypothetical protein